MPLTQTFFTLAQAVLWCILWLPVLVPCILTGGLGMLVGMHYSQWLGMAIMLVGLIILLDVAGWIERHRRAIVTCSLRTSVILYGTAAYLAEAGLRSYDIRLIEGEIEVRYRFPSLLVIASPDPTTIPRTLWEISVETY